MKKLLFKQRSDTPHWVGDGFPVRSIFTYREDRKEISPFLLMDYMGPVEFPASNSEERKGVGEHPHRGFETVTIVYSGQVEHRDSFGGGGVIGSGDVQWMTAASGLVHEERHGREFAKTGGLFEGVQLWVNLPAKDKMSRPQYQGIRSQNIPVVPLENNGGQLRVIAGDLESMKGPAQTFTPINVWDLRLNAEHQTELRMPKGFTTLIFVLSGKVRLASGEVLGDAELGVLSQEEEVFTLEALSDAKVLVLGGEPIHEPVIGFGPFVMNTPQQIQEAFADFNSGKMGSIAAQDGLQP